MNDLQYKNPLRRIRTFMLLVLQEAFKSPYLINSETPDPTFQYVVDANNAPTKESKVIFTDTFSKDLFAKSPRPLVVSRKTSLNFIKQMLDNTVDYGVNANLANERQLSYDTSLLFQCYHRSDVECEDLAWAVSGVMLHYRANIQATFNLEDVGVPQINPAVPDEQYGTHDLYVADINLSIRGIYHFVNTPLIDPKSYSAILQMVTETDQILLTSTIGISGNNSNG